MRREGQEPERAFKESFNVRTGSELHKQAALAAAKKGESLNKFVTEAIAAAL
ncbi:MAG: toxin-antitoxin system HicB family antitoxin [Collinsella sp.]